MFAFICRESNFAPKFKQYFYITNTSSTSHLEILANSEEVVAPALAALNFLPTIARYVDDAHGHGITPTWLLCCPSLHLVDIDILVPVMGSWGNNAHDILGDELCSEPTRPSPADSTEDQPTARLDVRHAIRQERSRVRDVLDNLKDGQNIHTLLWCCWQGQVLNSSVDVVQSSWFTQQRIGFLVLLCDSQDFFRGIYCRHRLCIDESCCRLGEYATTAANVKVTALFLLFCDVSWVEVLTALDEDMAQRVHLMEDAGGAFGVPP